MMELACLASYKAQKAKKKTKEKTGKNRYTTT